MQLSFLWPGAMYTLPAPRQGTKWASLSRTKVVASRRSFFRVSSRNLARPMAPKRARLAAWGSGRDYDWARTGGNKTVAGAHSDRGRRRRHTGTSAVDVQDKRLSRDHLPVGAGGSSDCAREFSRFNSLGHRHAAHGWVRDDERAA